MPNTTNAASTRENRTRHYIPQVITLGNPTTLGPKCHEQRPRHARTTIHAQRHSLQRQETAGVAGRLWSNQLRYSEKSFEIRFCAALSAAAMPLNRNPKWFGLTQAQERRVGIDAVLGIGGRLILFQFKAWQKDRIKLECEQLKKLTAVQSKYPRSTFYVFPEAKDIYVAGRDPCLFPKAWVFKPNDVVSHASASQKSISFDLDVAKKRLRQYRPSVSVAVENACTRLGCFCNKTGEQLLDSLFDPDSLLRFFAPAWGRLFSIADGASITDGIGIPIARDPRGKELDVDPITSEEQFEALFGDHGDGKDLEPGAYGFFIPSR